MIAAYVVNQNGFSSILSDARAAPVDSINHVNMPDMARNLFTAPTGIVAELDSLVATILPFLTVH